MVCVKGKKCSKTGGRKIFRAFKKRLSKEKLEDDYKVKKVDCFGLCAYAPVVCFEGLTYGRVTTKDCRAIIKHRFEKKKSVKKLLVKAKKKRA
jgi:NADH:ubiquinone oxidoreductase subunit E